jgi:acetyl-CoA carboxylase biotin carboxylase subunit
VAVYSSADREALHVKLADEAHWIGEAPARESYLRIDRLVEAAVRSGCGAVHPGYGFLAESEAFAEACGRSGLVFVGPSPSAIGLMGSKIASREAVLRAGVPVVPGSEGPVTSVREVTRLSERLGLPLLIKASAGGGGKGMRIVARSEEIDSALRAARDEAESSFGDATVYVEKYIPRPRHIEVQILADGFGKAIHLGERECSVQRRHQKLVEESPSPAVNPRFRNELGAAALAVARAAGYVNAGTVEFLVDAAGEPADWRFYFLEMNTRLQVEHPVTELVSGVDLVREQIRIAAGLPLDLAQSDVDLRGSAIECRIYAEDPARDFMPSPGRLTSLREPSGPGIRCDSGVSAGDVVPFEYDPLIAKLVAYGRDRDQAIRRMKRALREYRVGGVRTTIPFFQRLLNDAEFLAGRLHTGLIDSNRDKLLLESAAEVEEVAVLAAALAQMAERPVRPPAGRRPSRWRELGGRRSW